MYMKIIDYLLKYNLSVQGFAGIGSISYGAVYQYIKGHKPTLRNAMKIVKISNGEITLADLIGKEDARKYQD